MPTPRRTEPASALDAALQRVGDRWSLLLVERLLAGPRRFGELLEGLDGLAPNILSSRLKALEAEGIVTARPYSRRPPRVAYACWPSGGPTAPVPNRSATPPAARPWSHGGGAAPAPAWWRTARRPTWTTREVPDPRSRVGDEADPRTGPQPLPLVVVEAPVGGVDELGGGPAVVARPGRAVAGAHA